MFQPKQIFQSVKRSQIHPPGWIVGCESLGSNGHNSYKTSNPQQSVLWFGHTVKRFDLTRMSSCHGTKSSALMFIDQNTFNMTYKRYSFISDFPFGNSGVYLC